MSKLINKLVHAAGGWEKFLYQTLKEVCDVVENGLDQHDLADCEFTIEEDLAEAKEVLAAYEETTKVEGRQIHLPSTKVQPVVVDGSRAVESHKPMDRHIAGNMDAAQRNALANRVPPKPIRQEKSLAARINVDSEVGGSQGALPVPADCILHRRELMTITTQNGIELGRGSPDGQVRGQGVSGHVTLDGKYRLAFGDTALGTGLVNYTIIQKEEKEPIKPPPPVEVISTRPEPPAPPPKRTIIEGVKIKEPEEEPVMPTPPPLVDISEAGFKEVDVEVKKEDDVNSNPAKRPEGNDTIKDVEKV